MSLRHKFHISDSLRYDLAPEIKTDESLPLEQQLRSLIGIHCPTNVAKYQLLKRRDELLCRLRVRNTDVNEAKVLTGNCPDMCPEKERYMRDTQKNLNKYECDLNGVMIAERTVKDYSRSAADQEEPLPHELRPVNVLQSTMHYLIVKIANNIPQTAADMSKWYDFLWSRTRSIRKDITQQMLTGVDAADLVEKCARFHIFASFWLSHLEEADFSQKMNTENLSKSFQTLRHMYDDTAGDGRYCRNEAEFRSYDMILNLTDFNVHSEVLSYRSEIHTSEPVQLAVELASAFQSNNYVRFFRLLKDRASFLQSCLCYRHFPAIRLSALKVMVQAYRIMSLSAIADALGYDDDADALEFLHSFGLDVDTSDGSVDLISTRHRVLQSGLADVPPTVGTCRWISEKMGAYTLPEIFYNQPHVASEVRMPTPVNSFDELNRYTLDPVIRNAENDGRPTTSGLTALSAKSTAVPSSAVAPSLFQPAAAVRSSIFFASKSSFPSFFLPTFSAEVTAATTKAAVALFPSSSIIASLPTLTTASSSSSSQTSISSSSSLASTSLTTTSDDVIAASTSPTVVQTFTTTISIVRATTHSSYNRFLLVGALKVYASRWRRIAQRKIAQRWRREQKVFLDEAFDGLLRGVVYKQVKIIVEVQRKLAVIRFNLRRLWLKQFTDHWMKVIDQNRRLREIRLGTGSGSALCPQSYFGGRHWSAGKRPFTDRVQLALHLAEFRRARREHISRLYVRKWREFVDYRRRKRFVDGFFTNTNANGFGGDLYNMAKKRKAMSLTSFPDRDCSLSLSGFAAPITVGRPPAVVAGSESDRENFVCSTPITGLNDNVSMLQNKRRRLFSYFKSHQFSPI